ncbi:hypothetical protein H4582DRAFT_1989553, partial [Lactarius indigo]
MSRWSCSGRLEKAKEIAGAVPKQRLVRAQGGRHWRGHRAKVLQRIPERSRAAVGLSKNIGKWRDGDNGYAPILLSTNMSRLSFTSNLHLDLLAAAPVVSCGSSTSSTMPALLVTLHKVRMWCPFILPLPTETRSYTASGILCMVADALRLRAVGRAEGIGRNGSVA